METTTEIIKATLTKMAKTAITFEWYDYLIFVSLLSISSVIGIYFGCFGSKQKTANEYLFGGKHIGVVPIAVSLIASHISGVTLLGLPADVYRYGSGYGLCVICFVFSTLISNYVYLPVYFKLKITSIYEYLEHRFDARTRVMSSFLFALTQFLFLPIIIYIPALAFASATGINIHVITPIVCGICIFYTSIGGIKALVWTDTLQFTITILTTTCVLILGTRKAGGFVNIWQTAVEGKRLDVFDFDWDPTKRDTFWIIVIGFTVHWICITNTSQSCTQKFISLQTLKEARLASSIFSVGLGLVKTASVFLGLTIYTNYKSCDPFSTGDIKRNDQLLPYFVLTISEFVPTLAGFFIAGIFNAALSTLSAHLNCLSATIYQDFISKILNKELSEVRKGYILKIIVASTGIICTLLVFLFEKLGGILPLAIAFNGIPAGPMLGLFTLGMLFPKANKTGAFYGGICGLICILWISMGAQYYKFMGLMKYPTRPLSTEGCSPLQNLTSVVLNTTIAAVMKNSTTPEAPIALYRISYYYYATIGSVVTIITGFGISLWTSKSDDLPVDRDLISPVVYRWLPKEEKQDLQYNTIEKALDLVTYQNDVNDKTKA